MMSEEDTGDKKLLELAAKAAGFTLEEHYDDDQYYPWCAETEAFWNPLLDDGDAFRLMVELRIDVWLCEEKIAVAEYGLNGFCIGRCNEWLHDDPHAAVRRAIVRAAAEIGWNHD